MKPREGSDGGSGLPTTPDYAQNVGDGMRMRA